MADLIGELVWGPKEARWPLFLRSSSSCNMVDLCWREWTWDLSEVMVSSNSWRGQMGQSWLIQFDEIWYEYSKKWNAKAKDTLFLDWELHAVLRCVTNSLKFRLHLLKCVNKQCCGGNFSQYHWSYVQIQPCSQIISCTKTIFIFPNIYKPCLLVT